MGILKNFANNIFKDVKDAYHEKGPTIFGNQQLMDEYKTNYRDPNRKEALSQLKDNFTESVAPAKAVFSNIGDKIGNTISFNDLNLPESLSVNSLMSNFNGFSDKGSGLPSFIDISSLNGMDLNSISKGNINSIDPTSLVKGDLDPSYFGAPNSFPMEMPTDLNNLGIAKPTNMNDILKMTNSGSSLNYNADGYFNSNTSSIDGINISMPSMSGSFEISSLVKDINSVIPSDTLNSIGIDSLNISELTKEIPKDIDLTNLSTNDVEIGGKSLNAISNAFNGKSGFRKEAHDMLSKATTNLYGTENFDMSMPKTDLSMYDSSWIDIGDIGSSMEIPNIDVDTYGMDTFGFDPKTEAALMGKDIQNSSIVGIARLGKAFGNNIKGTVDVASNSKGMFKNIGTDISGFSNLTSNFHKEFSSSASQDLYDVINMKQHAYLQELSDKNTENFEKIYSHPEGTRPLTKTEAEAKLATMNNPSVESSISETEKQMEDLMKQLKMSTQ